MKFVKNWLIHVTVISLTVYNLQALHSQMSPLRYKHKHNKNFVSGKAVHFKFDSCYFPPQNSKSRQWHVSSSFFSTEKFTVQYTLCTKSLKLENIQVVILQRWTYVIKGGLSMKSCLIFHLPNERRTVENTDNTQAVAVALRLNFSFIWR